MEAFELQPSTWGLILQFCPESEAGEVKRLLGHSLVEQAGDLYEEVGISDRVNGKQLVPSGLRLVRIN